VQRCPKKCLSLCGAYASEAVDHIPLLDDVDSIQRYICTVIHHTASVRDRYDRHNVTIMTLQLWAGQACRRCCAMRVV
jgi:transposase-like protein